MFVNQIAAFLYMTQQDTTATVSEMRESIYFQSTMNPGLYYYVTRLLLQCIITCVMQDQLELKSTFWPFDSKPRR